jgi:hypothetical protein
MKLLYYITSHGYGHALRAASICNMLSPETEVIIRTAVPASFFSGELARSFAYAPAEYDCGCIQHDGVTVDVPQTLKLYRAIADDNEGKLDKEVSWCRSQSIDVIASDIVPFAFDVAVRAGIPSAAVTNFTWSTVYQEYAARYPDFAPYFDTMERQYAKADILLAMYPSNRMDCFRKKVDVGPVGRVGNNIRSQLTGIFNVPRQKRIGLIYTGNFGMDSITWKRLEMFNEWEFFGLYPLPGCPVNYHCISRESGRYQDWIASADVMVGKLGYGTCAECFINGLPVIYLPRSEFAEFPVLHQAVTGWGHGYMLAKEDFYTLNWQAALTMVEKRRKPEPMKSDGASACAKELEKLA